ncbi:hypothetical protein D3C73_362340 [compost metagenome]
MSTISTVQEQLENERNELQNKIVEIDQNGGAVEERQSLIDQLNAITNKIEEEKYKAQMDERLAQHETLVEETQSQVVNTLDNLRVGDKSLRELFLNATPEEAEAAYQVWSIVVKNEMLEVTAKPLQDIKDLNEELAAAKANADTIQKNYDALYEEAASLRTELAKIKADLADAESKRDAAVTRYETAEEEVKRLNSQVDDLRKEIAVGAANAPKVIDVGTAYDNYIKEKQKNEANKPAIYDVEAMDMRGSRYKAKLASTDEAIEFSYLEKNKYREVTAQEAESFRREYEAQRDSEDTAQPGNDVEAQVTPTQGDQPVNGVDEINVPVEVAGKTLEERVAALEAVVFAKTENGEAA